MRSAGSSAFLRTCKFVGSKPSYAAGHVHTCTPGPSNSTARPARVAETHRAPAWIPFCGASSAALARVDRTVEAIVVEHATSYWGRPVRRREVGLELDGRERRVLWWIENEPVLDFRFIEQGPATLVVHDFSLFDPLKRALRTRHVHVRYATVGDYRATYG